MKVYIYSFIISTCLINCTQKTNSSEFIATTTGRYLFNENEIIEVYFKETMMHIKWRGNDNIVPLKVNDSSFYVKELNEKLVFTSFPKIHIKLAPKQEHEGIQYHFKKLMATEKTPNEYLIANEFDNALKAYQHIQKKDSLNPHINERRINSIGYDFLRNKEYQKAIAVFKINTNLYPKSSNAFDSLGEAFLTVKDSANALVAYEKSLALNGLLDVIKLLKQALFQEKA